MMMGQKLDTTSSSSLDSEEMRLRHCRTFGHATRSIELFPERRELGIALLCVLALAFALRLAWALSGPPQRFDEYAGIAENLAAGRGYSWSVAGEIVPTDIRAPLYPLLLSASIAVTKSYALVVVWQALLSTASCFLAYVLGASLFTSVEGFYCAALCTIDFFQITMVRYLLTETLYIFLILLFQILLLYLLRSNSARLNIEVVIPCSIAIACAILVRPEAPVYFALIMIYVMYVNRKLGKTHMMRVGLIAGSAFVLMLPWMVRNYTVLGDFEISNGILVDFNMYRGLVELNGNPEGNYGFEFYQDIKAGKLPINPASSRQPTRQQVLEGWIAAIRTRPVAVAVERLRNLSRAFIYKGEYFFSKSMSLRQCVTDNQFGLLAGKLLCDIGFGILPWGLALWGSFLAQMKYRKQEWITLWIFPLSVALLMIPLWADPRYMLPAHVLLAPLGALSLNSVFLRVRKRAF
jgi:hypothetical protein